MEHTKEKLLEETSAIQHNVQIMGIVNDAESAQEADDNVSELEFPTPIARQARLLWKLKQEHTEEFDAIVQESASAEPETDPDQRIFPVNYRWHFESDLPGSLLVRPHTVLPTIFWEYELLDEDGETLFSTQDPVGMHKNHQLREEIECNLAFGSRSLPASLKIKLDQEAYGARLSFIATIGSVGSYPEHTNTFIWTRHFPLINGSECGDEWYERTVNHSESGRSHDRVLFRKLSEDEGKALHENPLGEYWALVLETDVNVPLDAQFSRYIPWTVTTIYDLVSYVSWQKRVIEDQYSFDKVKRAKLPYRNLGSAHWSSAPFVGHGPVRTNNGHDVRTYPDSIEKAIDHITQHTPKRINSLATLRHFFGFKSMNGTSIYNSSTTEEREKEMLHSRDSGPLPLWRPEKRS